jgi:hypothetical protein
MRLIKASQMSPNRGADPRASQETQGACILRLREAQLGPVPCSGAPGATGQGNWTKSAPRFLATRSVARNAANQPHGFLCRLH